VAQEFTVGVILPAKGGQSTILLRKNGTVPVLLTKPELLLSDFKHYEFSVKAIY
jgi:hypothetical protein